MSYYGVCAATVVVEEGGHLYDAVAIMSTTSIYDVNKFILCHNGDVVTEVWHYNLQPDRGCMTIKVG